MKWFALASLIAVKVSLRFHPYMGGIPPLDEALDGGLAAPHCLSTAILPHHVLEILVISLPSTTFYEISANQPQGFLVLTIFLPKH